MPCMLDREEEAEEEAEVEEEGVLHRVMRLLLPGMRWATKQPPATIWSSDEGGAVSSLSALSCISSSPFFSSPKSFAASVFTGVFSVLRASMMPAMLTYTLPEGKTYINIHSLLPKMHVYQYVYKTGWVSHYTWWFLTLSVGMTRVGGMPLSHAYEGCGRSLFLSIGDSLSDSLAASVSLYGSRRGGNRVW